MSLTFESNFGINDMTGAPQGKLTGGPFHNSIIELKDKDCEQITIQEDNVKATYLNTHNTNQEHHHIFLYEKGT